MTQVVVNLTDTFEQWRVKTNQVCENQGDIATLTTTDKDSLVDAINEIDSNNQEAEVNMLKGGPDMLTMMNTKR